MSEDLVGRTSARVAPVRLAVAMLFLVAMPGLPERLLSQEKTASPRSYRVLAGLNITQTGFSNWSEGGIDAIAYTANLQTELGYDFGTYRFSGQTKSVFGQTKQEGQEIRKATDELRVDLALIRKSGLKIDPYVSVSARSQFTEGFDYSKEPKELRSDFLNPVYVIESAGVGFEPRPETFVRLGLALKQTGVTRTRFAALYTDDATTERIEKWRLESGLEAAFSSRVEINTNLGYRTRLGLFTSFERLSTADVNWENVLTAKVASFVQVNLDVVLIYDEDISTRAQIKEVISIGLTYEIQR